MNTVELVENPQDLDKIQKTIIDNSRLTSQAFFDDEVPDTGSSRITRLEMIHDINLDEMAFKLVSTESRPVVSHGLRTTVKPFTPTEALSLGDYLRNVRVENLAPPLLPDQPIDEAARRPLDDIPSHRDYLIIEGFTKDALDQVTKFDLHGTSFDLDRMMSVPFQEFDMGIQEEIVDTGRIKSSVISGRSEFEGMAYSLLMAMGHPDHDGFSKDTLKTVYEKVTGVLATVAPHRRFPPEMLAKFAAFEDLYHDLTGQVQMIGTTGQSAFRSALSTGWHNLPPSLADVDSTVSTLGIGSLPYLTPTLSFQIA